MVDVVTVQIRHGRALVRRQKASLFVRCRRRRRRRRRRHRGRRRRHHRRHHREVIADGELTLGGSAYQTASSRLHRRASGTVVVCRRAAGRRCDSRRPGPSQKIYPVRWFDVGVRRGPMHVFRSIVAHPSPNRRVTVGRRGDADFLLSSRQHRGGFSARFDPRPIPLRTRQVVSGARRCPESASLLD